MLYADLPETLGSAVVGQLEANGALELLILGKIETCSYRQILPKGT